MKRFIIIAFFMIAITGIIFILSVSKKTLSGTNQVPTVGMITLSKVDLQTIAGFKAGLEKIGWKEGQDIRYIYDGPAGKIENLDTKINALLQKNIDLIFVSSTPGTIAVKKATQNQKIPVVFCPVTDPVGSGIVTSLKNPEGHITGVKLPRGDRQRMQWLHKIAPKTKTVFIPYTPGDKSSEFSRKQVRDAAQVLNIQIIEEPVSDPVQIKTILDKYVSKIDAIMIPRDSSIESYIRTILDYSIMHKLPVSAPSWQQVEQGALYTYGFIHTKLGEQASHLAHKILQGISPSNLPIEVGESHLVINQKTAKAIGLEIPDNILVQASKLIQ